MTLTSRLFALIYGPSTAVLILGASVRELQQFVYDHFRQRGPKFPDDGFYVFNIDDKIVYLKKIVHLSSATFTRMQTMIANNH